MDSVIVETDGDLLNVVGCGDWHVPPRCPFEKPLVPAAAWSVNPDAYSSQSLRTLSSMQEVSSPKVTFSWDN